MPHLIIGHTTSNSARIWARALPRWPVVHLEVLDAGDNVVYTAKPSVTVEEEFHTTVFNVPGLQPDTPYRAKVSFAKTTAKEEPRIRQAYCESRFRTFPIENGQSLRFFLGSCNLHSLGMVARPDRAWNTIAEHIRNQNPHFMLHCGDQIYADIPFQPIVSLDHYRRKYLDAWQDCVPAQSVLTMCPHYMILDDHEIDNDFDNGRLDQKAAQLLRSAALKVYWEFQHSHNPDTAPGSYHYQFTCGAAKFFVLDVRSQRDSTRDEIIDTKQLTELKRWLLTNKDDLKFIVTSVPFIARPRGGGSDKWHGFPKQRDAVLDYILEKDVKHTVFLTGDMHTSMASELTLKKGNKAVTLYELMSSPINQLTPDTPIKARYDVTYSGQTSGGAAISSRIRTDSFYPHSNIMAIQVQFQNGSPTISYSIHRTTKDEPGPTGVITF